MADERALTDFVLKAGDVSVRVEAGEVTAHHKGQPVTVKGLTLTGGPGGWSLTLDADPAPEETFSVEGEGQAGQAAPAPPAQAGPTAETPAPPRRPRR